MGKEEENIYCIMEKANIEKEKLIMKRRIGAWEDVVWKIMEEIKEKEKEDKRKEIEESKYNKVYKYIVTEEKPEYLRGKKEKKDRNIIPRYRYGNKIKGGIGVECSIGVECQYWREESKRRCRICGIREESMIHVLRECREIKEELTI